MNKLLTKKEMTSYLGISINTLNVWILKRKVPFVKLGTGRNAPVRFSPEEIESWLKNTKGKKLRNYEG